MVAVPFIAVFIWRIGGGIFGGVNYRVTLTFQKEKTTCNTIDTPTAPAKI